MTPIQEAWPIAIVTGFLGSGKTTLISRLLHHPNMADTMVIVNEFGEVGLDHHLFKAVTDNVILLPNGCLCCSIREDVVQTLRGLYKSWLAGSVPDFRRVVIETTGLADPAPLVASIASHPLLEEAFTLQSITTVVDAEHGFARQDRSLTNRNQICLADGLVISKCDRVEAAVVEVLERQLRELNPLAPVRRTDDGVSPAFLFSRTTTPMTRSRLMCDPVANHLDGVTIVVLRPEHRLAWPAFQNWLSTLLTKFGSRLMRMKGQISFQGYPSALIIQAVHQTFYPIAEVRGDEATPEENFLVFIFEGSAPPGLEATFSALQVSGAQLPV